MVPSPPFEHILRLTDERGIFEHADGIAPRYECGYCLDDVARALVVVCRQRPMTPALVKLADVYLRFIARAQAPDGRCHNRLDRRGRWEDRPDTGDWWGRALWGLGTAAALHPHAAVRAAALTRFDLSAARRSPHLHSMAFATLGAAEVLTAYPAHRPALGLLAAWAETAQRPDFSREWPWPQPRLTYANAAVAEALIAASSGLGDDNGLADGLRLLRWLLDLETFEGHLSVTPAGGWEPGEPRPAFDQQPIEVAALADACRRAFELTGERRWIDDLDRAIDWFMGDNDSHLALYDESTGGGYDALTPRGRNTNQGAESTLAMVSTLQHAAGRHGRLPGSRQRNAGSGGRDRAVALGGVGGQQPLVHGQVLVDHAVRGEPLPRHGGDPRPVQRQGRR